jgi:hypothetical protein
VLAVIGRNDAIFTVTAAGIASHIEKDHIFIRLDDAPGGPSRGTPRGWQVMTGSYLLVHMSSS